MLAARTEQWLVLPTPGVPVTIMLGCILDITEVRREEKECQGSMELVEGFTPGHLVLI